MKRAIAQTDVGMHWRRSRGFRHAVGRLALSQVQQTQFHRIPNPLSITAQDVRVTRIEHSHSRAAEKFTAGSSEFDLQRKKSKTVSKRVVALRLSPATRDSHLRATLSEVARRNSFSEQGQCHHHPPGPGVRTLLPLK
jgi:hypothetical protein